MLKGVKNTLDFPACGAPPRTAPAAPAPPAPPARTAAGSPGVQRKAPYYIVSHTPLHTTLHIIREDKIIRQSLSCRRLTSADRSSAAAPDAWLAAWTPKALSAARASRCTACAAANL
jgi:hypothetical protein